MGIEIIMVAVLQISLAAFGWAVLKEAREAQW